MILFAPTALASPKPTTATISTIAATLPTNSTASVRLFVDLENLVTRTHPASKSRALSFSPQRFIEQFRSYGEEVVRMSTYE